MNNLDKKKQFKLKDRVFRAYSNEGNVRISIIKNSQTVRDAQKKHNLDFVSATLLGKLMASAAMVASFLKGEERIILEVFGNGEIERLYAEALQNGESRGFVGLKDSFNPNHAKDWREILGIGLLKVRKVLYNEAEPTEGIVPMQKGDIATDLAYYFTQSEQIPSAVRLDVSIDDNGNIEHSGGIIIQALPDARDEDLELITKNIANMKNITEYFKDDVMPNEIIKDIIPFEYKEISNHRVDFFCRCSLDHFKSKLITLGIKELQDMQDKKQNELVCQYCNTKYYMTDKDYDGLKNELIAKRN